MTGITCSWFIIASCVGWSKSGGLKVLLVLYHLNYEITFWCGNDKFDDQRYNSSEILNELVMVHGTWIYNFTFF